MLPADSHVHTEWSWDAAAGDMVATCARAVELGVPAVAFTEHVDHTRFRAEPTNQPTVPPPFDVQGYLAAVEECRHRFPDLRVLSGAELGEPHRHAEQVAAVLAAGDFERVLGSVHALSVGEEGYAEPPALFDRSDDPARVVRAYLREVVALVEGSDAFAVLAHVDFPLRAWPATGGPVDVTAFEDELREVLRLLAASGRALEVNTRRPVEVAVVRWWHDVGGEAVSFASDTHDPDGLAFGFADAVRLAEACGFRPGRSPADLWGRA
jgi:histidinol-phosphatase (PHP family)